MKLQAHGIETDLLPGWEGRISLRSVPATSAKSDSGSGPEGLTGPVGNPGEIPNPVVHLANFALPEQRGDFGSGAVDLMTEDHVLVVLFEYGPESVGKALFRRKGLPTDLRPNMFSSAALQRTLPGQAGCQIFFTAENRAFCLFTVLGRQHAANRVLPQANATLAATRISPR
jgi:hypothetical protein